MADFASTEELQLYVNDKTATQNYPLVEAARLAAINELSNGCQRRWVTTQASTTRRYAPSSCDVVRIHDMTAVTVVVNNGTTLSASDYQLEPVDGLSWAGETVPYEQIRLLSGSWSSGTNRHEATISVTGTPGWPSIPSQIIEAHKIMTKDILSNRDVRFGLVAVTDVAGVSARTNPVVAAAIQAYRRVESFGIA